MRESPIDKELFLEIFLKVFRLPKVCQVLLLVVLPK